MEGEDLFGGNRSLNYGSRKCGLQLPEQGRYLRGSGRVIWTTVGTLPEVRNTGPYDVQDPTAWVSLDVADLAKLPASVQHGRGEIP